VKIGLLDVDGHNFPNLPLMKISAWHKRNGDDVEKFIPLLEYDKVYISKVFTFTSDYEAVIRAGEIIKGGTGYGLNNKLPDEIEHIYPDYSLYPQYPEAYGFLTRGCPRNCKFCIVAEKEGCHSQKVADLDEFWNNQKTIKLLDPNLLACKDRENLLEQLADSKAYIDFTQGLDIRFMTEDIAKLISNTKVKMIHFAWDNPKDSLEVSFEKFRAMSTLRFDKLRVYVLVNFDTTIDEDLYRIYTLRQLGYDPFVMVYDRQNASRETKDLQRWVNNKWVFRSCKRFEDYNRKIG